jgi:hypothetical protein
MQDSSAFQYLAIDTIHESTTNPRRWQWTFKVISSVGQAGADELIRTSIDRWHQLL